MAFKVEYKVVRRTADGNEVRHVKRTVEGVTDINESVLLDPDLEFLTIRRVKEKEQ